MTDLIPDPRNANKGTARGRGMLERSLQQYGAGRAPVVSADGVIIAGNKTIEVAQELGIPVQEIESDGRTLYVIRRTDLPYDDPRARELAIADNRVGQVSLDWDSDVLAGIADDGVGLGQFWFEDELAAMLATVDDTPPTLDELAQRYGETSPDVFWADIRIRAPQETADRFWTALRACEGDDDAGRLSAMLDLLDVGGGQ